MTLVARCDFYFRLTSYGDFYDLILFLHQTQSKEPHRGVYFIIIKFISFTLIKIFFGYPAWGWRNYVLKNQISLFFLKFKNKRQIFRFLLKTFFFLFIQLNIKSQTLYLCSVNLFLIFFPGSHWSMFWTVFNVAAIGLETTFITEIFIYTTFEFGETPFL